jgi:hypothetical protein
MEITRIKKSIASLALAGTLFGGAIVGASAAPVTQVTHNGAGGVVAAAVAALNNVNANNNKVDVAIVQLSNSLNNLTALNNVLNNSPILSNNNILQNITVGDVNVLNKVVTVGNITLTDVQVAALNNILSQNGINIGQVVGIAVLSGGDLLVFTR